MEFIIFLAGALLRWYVVGFCMFMSLASCYPIMLTNKSSLWNTFTHQHYQVLRSDHSSLHGKSFIKLMHGKIKQDTNGFARHRRTPSSAQKVRREADHHFYRIVNPCAGSLRSRSVGPAVVPQSFLQKSLPNRLLQLSRESTVGLKHVSAMKSMFPAEQALLASAESWKVLNFNRTVLESEGDIDVTKLLYDIYVKLATSALVLSDMQENDPYISRHGSFTKDLTHIKENIIYNVMCGVNVLLGPVDLTQQDLARLRNSRLPDVGNEALRFLRDYSVLREIENMFHEIRKVLRLVAARL